MKWYDTDQQGAKKVDFYIEKGLFDAEWFGFGIRFLFVQKTCLH
jgi:hypothetical protein